MLESKYLDKIGLEIEGQFTLDTKDLAADLGQWTWDGSVQVYKEAGTQNGEINTLPASSLTELRRELSKWETTKVNGTCGQHIHISVASRSSYDLLATKEFYYHFMASITLWGQATLPESHEFWSRLAGDNSYCCPNFAPCKHGHSESCEHEHDRDCYESCCDHDCESSSQMRRAREGNRSCLELSCEHSHNIACYSCDHDCNKDCEETCDHECESDNCSTDECDHVCEDTDCFAIGDCRHECDEDRCYEIACSHEDDCDCESSDEDIHSPDQQRRLNDKSSNRYAHINYCERLHGTIEFRLFPAFDTVQERLESCVALINIVSSYLASKENEEWVPITAPILETSSNVKTLQISPVYSPSLQEQAEFERFVSDWSSVLQTIDDEFLQTA